MPLKIESGSYEVNRRNKDSSGAPIKKSLSKFSVWKHWRRSVHEDRGTSEERRAGVVIGNSSGNSSSEPNSGGSGGGGGRREVAGLLARPDSPGSSLPRTSRRSRPHSLAVQPLNYQRLDPELQLQAAPAPPRVNVVTVAPASRKKTTSAAEAGKHPSMTSQESIGSCSLDVERSASDRSDLNAGSLSEKTLHSLALSTCNGDSSVEPAIRISQHYHESLSNGHEADAAATAENDTSNPGDGTVDEADEQLTRFTSGSKKPSYLGLACSISGYSGITRYDSKLREGFRSRDSSPGARLIVRDTSPAGFRSSDSQSLTPQPNQPKSQSISPLAMDRQRNGLSNGVRDKCGKAQLDSRTTSPYSSDGHSEVDRGVTVGRDEAILSPIRASSPNCKAGSPVAARIASYNQQNRSYVAASSPKSFNVSHTSHNESSLLNGSSLEQDASICIQNASSGSEKSFIQQRVERLYGPGALAQGFYKRGGAPRSKLNASSDAPSLFSRSFNNNTSADEEAAAAAAAALDDEESLKSLPVLRHLRPEFRAQLPVVSPRRPTDGTEQVIKPLKRISLLPTKTDTKETKESSVKQKIETAAADTNMTLCISNNADQQLAAPEVVLPAVESSVNLPNSPKVEVQPGTIDDREKDGHYYLNLLNTEKNRLLAMSQQAQDELANCTELGIPEEAAGKLRSAIGKTGLLTEQRMKQFEGLCQKNINKVPNEEFPTTNQDLAGFWDMVMLQVDNIDEMYDVIKTLRKSGWQEAPDRPVPSPEQRSVPSTPQNGTAGKRRQTPASKTKSAADAEASRKAREAREQSRRQMLEERRRAMRANANKSTDNAIEIFVPET